MKSYIPYYQQEIGRIIREFFSGKGINEFYLNKKRDFLVQNVTICRTSPRSVTFSINAVGDSSNHYHIVPRGIRWN